MVTGFPWIMFLEAIRDKNKKHCHGVSSILEALRDSEAGVTHA